MLVNRSFESDYHVTGEESFVARLCKFKDIHSSHTLYLEECTARIGHAVSIHAFKGRYATLTGDEKATAENTTVLGTIKGRFVTTSDSKLNIVEAVDGASITDSSFKVVSVSNGPLSIISKEEIIFAHEISARDKIVATHIAVDKLDSKGSLILAKSSVGTLIAYNVLNVTKSYVKEATLHVTQDSPIIELYDTVIDNLTLVGKKEFTPIFHGCYPQNFKTRIEPDNSHLATDPVPPNI